MIKTEFEKKFKIEFKKFNVFKFNEKTRKRKLLGVVIASNCPDAIIRGWKKFKIPKIDYRLIYAQKLRKGNIPDIKISRSRKNGKTNKRNPRIIRQRSR